MLGYDDETSAARAGESVGLLKRGPQDARASRRLDGVPAGDRALIDGSSARQISMSQTILLVDDDDAVRELFARMLRSDV